MYQKVWQDIKLTDIADALGLKTNQVAAVHFYEEYYKKLRDSNYNFQCDWLESKRKMGEWLKVCIDIEEKNANKKLKILSVGAGLGVVEEILIIDTYDIEIQECQENSFDYLHRQGIIPNREWVTYNLRELPVDSYDIIFVNLVVYAFETESYFQFLKDINYLLKKEGKLILVEQTASLQSKLSSIIKNLINIIKSDKDRVFWGWIRTGFSHKSIAKKAGFEIYDLIPY